MTHKSGSEWRLDEKLALVTGASSGLGERCARVLVRAGATVVVTARSSSLLETLAEESGERVRPLAGDITKSVFREKLARYIGSFGRLDILVNNAGSGDSGPLESQSLEDITRVLDLNLVSVIDLCRLLAPYLFASSSASVVNVASIFGLVTSRDAMAGYNTSKGALVHFTRHLAAQWGRPRCPCQRACARLLSDSAYRLPRIRGHTGKDQRQHVARKVAKSRRD